MDEASKNAARAVDEIEGRAGKSADQAGDATHPAAGPHAREDLTSPEATPGAGALPEAGTTPADVDGGAG